ncbi:acetylcholine receptor subunit alpha-L1-like [Physella acuta]|uniref:acetylcholine receptor subunit alpha-L1-like n=1 Tax=Physella acuta TaxID=109671 RepID=UPI0027DCAD4B|nr:acetylcholine receptor subunit alpha-L1-like [Physella acuta]
MAPGSIILLMTLVLTPQVQGQTFQQNNSLLNDKFSSDAYNPRVRPVKNSSDVTVVSVGFRIVSIVDFNRGTGELKFLEDVHFSWTDEFLTWDPADYGGQKGIRVEPAQVWRPLVYLQTIIPSFHPVADVTGVVDVRHTGLVSWAPQYLNLHADCREQPSDTLKCELHLASQIHPAHQLQFVLEENQTETTHESRNRRWEILNARVDVVKKTLMFLHRIDPSMELLNARAGNANKTLKFFNQLYSTIQVDLTVQRIRSLNERMGILPMIIPPFISVLLFIVPLPPGKKLYCAPFIMFGQCLLSKISDLSRPGMRELSLFLSIMCVCNWIVLCCLYAISGMSEEETESKKVGKTKANIQTSVTPKTLHAAEQNGGDVTATPKKSKNKMTRTIYKLLIWIFIFSIYAFLIGILCGLMNEATY